MIAPRPILSIVLTTCNQVNSLKLTLGSLELNPPDIPFEVLVLDCGSDVATAQFLAVQAQKGTVQRLFTAEGVGRTAARNRVAGSASGRFLMFLDPGMIVGPHWWSALVQTLDMDPEVGAVAGKIIVTDGRIDHAGLAVLEWRPHTGQGKDAPRLTGRSIHAGKPADTPGSNRALNVQALAGEGLMVRTESFTAVRGFNPEIGRRHRTDKEVADGDPAGLDLCLRLGRRGWRCVYRPESVLTRLRANEGNTNEESTPDRSAHRLAGLWFGTIQADFLVGGEAGVVPQQNGFIRPYIEPVLRFGIPADSDFSSVVVLTHNALDYTKACLHSVLRHTDSHHELILVDNGSTDGTVEYLQQIILSRPGSRLILNQENLGFAGGNNQGLAAARGKHIILLNSDAVVTAGWLERLVETAEEYPRAGLLGPVTNNISGMQKLTSVGYDEANLSGLSEFAVDCGRCHDGRVERALRLTGFCLLIKRELLARIGGLDERFGQGNYEDNDYCLRAHLAGYESLIVRSCFVHHFGGASFQAAGVDYDAQIRRQWEIFRSKWKIPVDVAFNSPFNLGEILAGGFDPQQHFHALPESTPEWADTLKGMEAKS
jgi:GT2 family glycosyltransferase